MGEAISGQIATAFSKTHTPWNNALKAIGIVGVVVAVLIRLLIREPARRSSLIKNEDQWTTDQEYMGYSTRLARAKLHFKSTLGYVLRMRSFWLLTLSSGARQLSGNVFGTLSPLKVYGVLHADMSRILHAGLSDRHLPIPD